MNVFLKGLASAPDIIKCIIDKSLMDYYDLKDKTILVVKNRQLLRAMRNSTAPAFQRPFQCFDSHRPPPQYQYNSSNAPHTMNNVPVPMDLSRGCFPPHRGGQGQGQFQTRGNIIQLEETNSQFPRVRKCYNCNKPGHFARECHTSKQA